MPAIDSITRSVHNGLRATADPTQALQPAGPAPRSDAGRTSEPQTSKRPDGGRPEGGTFSSSKMAIAALLGVVTYPPPATMKVNGRTVLVDLAVDSLSSIAARVLAEARTKAASLAEETGGSLRYRLAVKGETAPSNAADGPAVAVAGSTRSPSTDASADPIAPEIGRDPMVERFIRIDDAMNRIREQAAPLKSELRALEAAPFAG